MIIDIQNIQLPFNQENFDKLYEQRPTKESSSVSMVIYQKAQANFHDR